MLAMIRNGQEMSGSQKLNLIVQLSVPSILAQLTTIMMFYIDASMVGSLGARASASIGIVEFSEGLRRPQRLAFRCRWPTLSGPTTLRRRARCSVRD